MEDNPSNFYLSGEIQGISKEEKKKKEIINNNKMEYIVKNIKEEINLKFKDESDLYIYDRFTKKYNILKIFVILLNDTKFNKRNIDITYLIIVKEEYPICPPLVFCLTQFNKKLDIFDMRNIQKNLIPEWSNNYTINDLIIKLPLFTDNLDYQVSKKLMPIIGEYEINSMCYDLNDFLLNNNNKFFRAFILLNDDKNEKVEFYPIYIIITNHNMIFLKPGHKPTKNLCKIKYVINLVGIERIRRFLKEGEKFQNLSCFKIVGNKNFINESNSNILNKTICADDIKLIVKQINECINKRKDDILNYYKFFENSENNDVKKIEKIIEIKEKIVEKKVDENILCQIQELYNKLIEISSDKEEYDFSVYVKKLQNFLDHYDKIKNEEIEKDKNNINLIKNNYNFGFD